MSGDDEHRERQRMAQEQWCDGLAYWIPISPWFGEIYAVTAVRDNHDPGDEDRSER